MSNGWGAVCEADLWPITRNPLNLRNVYLICGLFQPYLLSNIILKRCYDANRVCTHVRCVSLTPEGYHTCLFWFLCTTNICQRTFYRRENSSYHHKRVTYGGVPGSSVLKWCMTAVGNFIIWPQKWRLRSTGVPAILHHTYVTGQGHQMCSDDVISQGSQKVPEKTQKFKVWWQDYNYFLGIWFRGLTTCLFM